MLELLLSQERVISLLYDRALPPRMSFGGFGGIADIVTAGRCMLSLLRSLLTPPLPLTAAPPWTSHYPRLRTKSYGEDT